MRSVAERTLLLATRSTDKLREIRSILGDLLGTIISLDEAGLESLPEEDGVEAFDTFIANAEAKARYFARRSGLPVLADDSGISVAALGGAPGVRSKRFSAEGTDEANNELLLRRLAGVPHEERTAHYTCAAVLLREDGTGCTALGTCAGFILEQPRGTHGFGYDPLFLDPLSGQSFAELDPAAKDRMSHRSRAFRALVAAT